jgi:hypothetical protein
MKNKWNTVAWVFLVSGVLLLVNATSRAGLFPSGHGVGRVPEVIQGFAFVICSVAYLIYRRRKAASPTRAS